MDNLNIDSQIEDQKKKEFQVNAEKFNKELAKLQDKFSIVVIPTINVTKFGIMPSLELMDKKMFELKTSSVAKN